MIERGALVWWYSVFSAVSTDLRRGTTPDLLMFPNGKEITGSVWLSATLTRGCRQLPFQLVDSEELVV